MAVTVSGTTYTSSPSVSGAQEPNQGTANSTAAKPSAQTVNSPAGQVATNTNYNFGSFGSYSVPNTPTAQTAANTSLAPYRINSSSSSPGSPEVISPPEAVSPLATSTSSTSNPLTVSTPTTQGNVNFNSLKISNVQETDAHNYVVTLSGYATSQTGTEIPYTVQNEQVNVPITQNIQGSNLALSNPTLLQSIAIGNLGYIDATALGGQIATASAKGGTGFALSLGSETYTGTQPSLSYTQTTTSQASPLGNTAALLGTDFFGFNVNTITGSSTTALPAGAKSLGGGYYEIPAAKNSGQYLNDLLSYGVTTSPTSPTIVATSTTQSTSTPMGAIALINAELEAESTNRPSQPTGSLATYDFFPASKTSNAKASSTAFNSYSL